MSHPEFLKSRILGEIQPLSRMLNLSSPLNPRTTAAIQDSTAAAVGGKNSGWFMFCLSAKNQNIILSINKNKVKKLNNYLNLSI